MPKLEYFPNGTMVLNTESYRAVAIGPTYQGSGSKNWSMRHIYPFPQNLLSHHVLPLAGDLPGLCERFRIPTILAPEPGFDIAACSKDNLRHQVHLSSETNVWFSSRHKRFDITKLERGETGLLTPAGCATVVFTYRRNSTALVMLVHAGRNNLVNLPALLGDVPRLQESVIFAAKSCIVNLISQEEWKHVEADILFPIPPELFEHPKRHPEHGQRNQLLLAHFKKWGGVVGERIDIAKTISAQCEYTGLPRSHVRCFGQDIAGDPSRWYTTRGPEEDRSKRNLVLITAY